MTQPGAFRDGLFSQASPAVQYQKSVRAFADGALGLMSGGAEEQLRTALRVLQKLAQVRSRLDGDPDARSAASATAMFAQTALDLKSLPYTMAAVAAAQRFPKGALAAASVIAAVRKAGYNAVELRGATVQASQVVNKVLGPAAPASVSVALKKAAMSGVYQDGVLGSVYRDGVLGATSPAVQAALQRLNSNSRSGYVPVTVARARRKPGAALRGGCGCSGMGADTVVLETDTPFYKKPGYIAGAAVVLGIGIYALSKR